MRARRIALVATLAAGLALGVTSCSSGDDTAKVCQDEKTHVRVEDSHCNDQAAHPTVVVFYRWIFLPRSSAPSVGERIRGGSVTPPRGTTVRDVEPVEPHIAPAPVEEPVEPHIVVGGER